MEPSGSVQACNNGGSYIVYQYNFDICIWGSMGHLQPLSARIARTSVCSLSSFSKNDSEILCRKEAQMLYALCFMKV
jgi:hypothetical protein